jgi:Catalase
MVLNRNIDNFNNESEQIAFSPGIAVPGPLFVTHSNLIFDAVWDARQDIWRPHIEFFPSDGWQLQQGFPTFLTSLLVGLYKLLHACGTI